MKAVREIILINVVIFITTTLLEMNGLYLNNILALYPINSEYFNIYQYITHCFSHKGFDHIFFNMLILFLVGSEVESEYGYNKFWKFYILSAIFSSGIYSLFENQAILGASGAVFSVIGSSILICYNNENFKNFISLKYKTLFFLILSISEFYYAIFDDSDGIAHWAHVFGLIIGMIFYVRNKYANPK